MAKKVVVDRSVLKDWMKKQGIDYRGLAERSGMSVTQSYNLVRSGSGGAVTLGYLVAIGVPLILIETDSKGKVSNVHPLEVRVL